MRCSASAPQGPAHTWIVQLGAPQYWSACGCRVTGAPDGLVALSVTGAGASMRGGPTTTSSIVSEATLPFESTIVYVSVLVPTGS